MADTLNRIFLEAVDSQRVLFMRKTATGWISVSGAQAFADVESLALALAELGVKRGDHVGLVSETRYEWTVADLAILGLGAVTVPIYPSLTPEQCAFVFGNAECAFVIASEATQLEKLRAAKASLPAMTDVVVMDVSRVTGAGAAGFREHVWGTLLARGGAARAANPSAFRASAEQAKAGDLATIIYTSGTTGEPKGAMLTHGNIASNVEACLEIVTFEPGEVSLSFLPLCHIFERMGGLYAMLRAGVTIAYAESFDQVSANAREVHPMIINAVPRFYEKVRERVIATASGFAPLRRRIFEWGMGRLIGATRARFERRPLSAWATWQVKLADRLVAAKIREFVGGRLRLCISGGAPLSADVLEFFFAIGIRILEGYGLTETSPVICLNRPGREKPASVGPPIPGVEVRIGEDGEVLTRGPHVMKGYFGNPEATRAAIRDGWFHTGDVGRIDQDGCLVITDRLKDLIVTAGGKKVAPQPLEARLKLSPWISEAVLLGDRHPYIVALIVPNFAALEVEGQRLGWPTSNRDSLLAHDAVRALVQAEIDAINRDLAPFERIKRFAFLPRELSQDRGEITPTLKVKRRVILERYAPLILELYPRQQKAASA